MINWAGIETRIKDRRHFGAAFAACDVLELLLIEKAKNKTYLSVPMFVLQDRADVALVQKIVETYGLKTKRVEDSLWVTWCEETWARWMRTYFKGELSA